MSSGRGMLDIFKRENTKMYRNITNVSQLYFKENGYIYPHKLSYYQPIDFLIKMCIDN